MTKNYYITTPIYYVNDIPHIGHAYTSLACDVLARFMRLDGRNVKFLTGTDEHGQKVEKSAIKLERSPQDFVDEMHLSFRKLGEALCLSNDDFIRTTEERHKKAASALWSKLLDNGSIYLGKYAGWYSVRDEAFYAETELTAEGLAPTGATVEWVEEPSYFFALSKWQDKLLEFYEANPDFIMPKSRRNEVISFVKSGLHDLSVSRTSFKWGISVPGDEDHIMYVWLDALTNYISALGYPENTDDFEDFWPSALHIIGKDITRFHAVYWPAFLMAADIAPPKKIMAHGWWTNEGEKISKSVGNVIDPIKLIDEFGLDQTRYFLMKEIIFGNDGNYSRANMISKINSDLANNIGNLIQRTLSFVQKYAEGMVPESADLTPNEMISATYLLRQSLVEYMENQDINSCLDIIIELSSNMNVYIDAAAPWQLRKTDPAGMANVLYILLEMMRCLAIYLQPFIPGSAEKMLNALNIPKENRDFSALNWENRIVPGTKLPEPEPIFPRFV
jgi:methionyl-tRNA synthetase